MFSPLNVFSSPTYVESISVILFRSNPFLKNEALFSLDAEGRSNCKMTLVKFVLEALKRGIKGDEPRYG